MCAVMRSGEGCCSHVHTFISCSQPSAGSSVVQFTTPRAQRNVCNAYMCLAVRKIFFSYTKKPGLKRVLLGRFAVAWSNLSRFDFFLFYLLHRTSNIELVTFNDVFLFYECMFLSPCFLLCNGDCGKCASQTNSSWRRRLRNIPSFRFDLFIWSYCSTWR